MTPAVLAALFGGAAAGAVLNQLFGFLTSWMTRRHEHRRWLLDKRLEVYSEFNKALNAWRMAHAHFDSEKAVTDAVTEVGDWRDQVMLLSGVQVAAATTQIALDAVDATSDLLRMMREGERRDVVLETAGVAVAGIIARSHHLQELQRRDVAGWSRT